MVRKVLIEQDLFDTYIHNEKPWGRYTNNNYLIHVIEKALYDYLPRKGPLVVVADRLSRTNKLVRI